MLLGLADQAGAQAPAPATPVPPNPRQAQPERPTVATHAFTVAELFGLPGSSGPAGAPPVVGFLTGPTFEVGPSVVVDAGAILNVSGLGDTAFYAGVTWNMGRVWGAPPGPQVDPSWRMR
jgi:hypothetical protein